MHMQQEQLQADNTMAILSTAASLLSAPMVIAAAQHFQRSRALPLRKSYVKYPDHNPESPPAPLSSQKRNLSIFAHSVDGYGYTLLYAREVCSRCWLPVPEALEACGNLFRESLASKLVQGGYLWLKVGFVRNCPIEAGKHKNQDSYQQTKYRVLSCYSKSVLLFVRL